MPQVGQALTKSYTGYIITPGVRNCAHVQKGSLYLGARGRGEKKVDSNCVTSQCQCATTKHVAEGCWEPTVHLYLMPLTRLVKSSPHLI